MLFLVTFRAILANSEEAQSQETRISIMHTVEKILRDSEQHHPSFVACLLVHNVKKKLTRYSAFWVINRNLMVLWWLWRLSRWWVCHYRNLVEYVKFWWVSIRFCFFSIQITWTLNSGDFSIELIWLYKSHSHYVFFSGVGRWFSSKIRISRLCCQ